MQIYCAKLENGLYVLHPFESKNYHTEIFGVANSKSNKRQQLLNDFETHLWHLRLGYISLDRINQLTKNGSLKDLSVRTLPVCESCLEGKITKRPFYYKGTKSRGTSRAYT